MARTMIPTYNPKGTAKVHSVIRSPKGGYRSICGLRAKRWATAWTPDVTCGNCHAMSAWTEAQ